MSAPPQAAYRTRARRRPRLLVWVGVLCVAAVVIESAVVTNGFGLATKKSSSSSNGIPGPNPNPAGELVTSVTGQLTYSGSGSNPFPALSGGDLCPGCPKLPKEYTNNGTNFDGLWFYFNVSNAGKNGTTLSNFSLTTSGANPHLFVLLGVECCYTTHSTPYSEPTDHLYVPPNSSPIGLAVFVTALAIPGDGTTGYALTLHMTCP